MKSLVRVGVMLWCPLAAALSPDLDAALPLLRLRGGFGLVGGAIASYNNALALAPLQTNMASAASLAVLSDSIAQGLAPRENGPAVWDFERSAWMSVWGAIMSGAVIFYWLRFLTWLCPLARTSLSQLGLKVFVNQLVMSPGLNGGFFAFVVWTRTAPRLAFNVAKRQQLMAKYRADLLTTCLRSCYFWSVVQTVNFRVLPPQYGVLFTNAAFVLWTTYLSLVGNRPAKAEGAKEE